MAKEEAPTEGYQRLATGLGTKIQFGDDDGQLKEYEGFFIGNGVYHDEKAEEDYRYLQFRNMENPDIINFCWETYELATALAQAAVGQQVKIVYLGSDAADVGRVKKFAVYVKQ